VTTAVLAVPEDAVYEGPGAPVERRSVCAVQAHLPSGRAFRPRPWPGLLSRDSRVTLVVGERELAHRDRRRRRAQHPVGRLVEAALPSEDGRAVFVVGRNLCSAVVDEQRFGRRAVAAVQARVPAARWLPRPRTAGDDLVAVAVPGAGAAGRP
jgi:hypothetical protein